MNPAPWNAAGSPGSRRLHLALLATVLGAGIALRLTALFALPDFFGPGDPTTYYAMARSSLHEGAPRIGFVWQYGSLPSRIEHVEDYFEPAFSYVLAGALAAFGERPFSARLMLLILGSAVPLLVYAGARRFGPGIALISAAIVALEPWSIYYSATLMKESLVAVVLILVALLARRTLAAPPGSRRGGVALACGVLGAGLFQYELLPILIVACAVALAIHRRDLLVAFVASIAIGGAVLVAVTLMWLGVPVSAKFAFFSGRHLWSPIALRTQSLARYLPLVYVVSMVLLRFYPALLATAWMGARDPRHTRPENTWTLALLGAFLYFHGVPHDLWECDFIPLVPILAPLVATAIMRPALWRESPMRGVIALGVAAGAWFGPHAALQLYMGGVVPVGAVPLTVIAASLVIAALFTELFRRVGRHRLSPHMRWALPVGVAAIVLAVFSRSLPWLEIVDNPQFPPFQERQIAWSYASDHLRRSYPKATVMTSAPSEVALYSGLPTVLLPLDHDAGAISMVARRYRPDVMFVRAGELPPRLIASLRLLPLERFLGCEVWAFPHRASSK